MPEEFVEKMRRMDRSSSAFKHIADVKHHSTAADGTSSSSDRARAKEEIDDMKRQLESMLSFLRLVDHVRNPNDMVANWVKLVRDKDFQN
ncbi:hypothetical protein QJS10_CPA08g01755 [Acorus calamus]|uniref:Uncharacterized protein n=1 Tax=Acorus calamus TaxID=4465 RepID=A0AAV9EAL7_ACOCL|nr:hypothetical protein QJS10_CPA08g01755 [Acorus calamus]